VQTEPVLEGGLAIEVHGVEKRYGTTAALDGVDLTVPSGQVFALLGPNGAGKTTLVRILSTLLAPDAGTARVAGFDVVRQGDRVRAAIGLTGQFAAIDDLLSGRENLEMAGELFHLPRNEARRRAGDLLDRFDLSEAGDRLAKTYSGGMRRRLDLGACLIARPPVVVLDEPTTGLDPASRLGLWQVIEELAEAGTSVLLTTQYLEEADRLARRIAVIDRGKVVAEGSPTELKRQLGGEVVEVVADDDQLLDAAVSALEPLGNGQLHVDRQNHRATVPAPDGQDTLIEALRHLQDAGVRLDDIGLRRPSLDDVFLHLTDHHDEPVPEPIGRSR
jgi:ABC-2 type transport system ATP-binding protein